jgi:hypothetical protein
MITHQHLRYARRSGKQRIAEDFRLHPGSMPDFGIFYNVTPQTSQPIVRLNRNTGEPEISKV